METGVPENIAAVTQHQNGISLLLYTTNSQFRIGDKYIGVVYLCSLIHAFAAKGAGNVKICILYSEN
jgi:hypothetical protein